VKVRKALLEKYLCYIGANLHRYRKAKGLTQEQLADRAGVELSFYQRLERAKTNVSLASLIALSSAIEIPMPMLLEPARLHPAQRGRPKRSVRWRRS
jgi:transcriptional regulator with XRE-family HTH domain